MSSASNFVRFRRPAPQTPAKATDLRRRKTKSAISKQRNLKEDREIACAIIEEHLGSLERAALIVGHSLQRQRTLLEELRPMEGWDWSIPSASALFGDAMLFSECELRVVDRFTRKPVEG
jgi:hypothetical protein